MARKSALSADLDLEGWLPMSSAPRDGTLILICELGSGDDVYVIPAAYLCHMGGEHDFWGVGPTSHLPPHLCFDEKLRSAVRDSGLPADFKNLAITPLCWKPFPRPEPVAKLRRREAALLANKFKKMGIEVGKSKGRKQ